MNFHLHKCIRSGEFKPGCSDNIEFNLDPLLTCHELAVVYWVMKPRNLIVFFLKLENVVVRYRRLIVVLIAVIIIQIFESILLHYKYDLFTGGFLQPFSYKTIPERLTFILSSLCFDLSLVGLLASLWFFIADKLSKYGLIIYYSFTVIVVFLTGIWLAINLWC